MDETERKERIKKISELEDLDPNEMRFFCGCNIPITKENKDLGICPTHNTSKGLRCYTSSRSIVQTLRTKYKEFKTEFGVDKANKNIFKGVLESHANTMTDYNDEEHDCDYCGRIPRIAYWDNKSCTACCSECKKEMMETVLSE